MISIVIPNYNREALILDALNSVDRQSYRPIEIIVVDDGSTDHSISKIEEWKALHESTDLKLRLIKQPNSGGNAARNNGILNSSADFIAFLDSDDLWDPNKLSKQFKLINAKPDCGAVYCGLKHVQAENGKVIEEIGRQYPSGSLLSSLLIKDVTAPTSCYLIKKEVFDKVGLFDTELQARQDWDMWIRIAEYYNIEAVPENLVLYRHHEGERTISDPWKEIRAYKAIRSKYQKLYGKLSSRNLRKANAAFHKRMGRVKFHQGISKSQALTHYFKACVLDPFDFDNYAALAGFFIPSGLRKFIHRAWNAIFGKTALAIRSH